ncbi:MAG TPA: hypothetical protein VGW38_05715, partial [Chloroflexota bacterium]|nr:hypothetical protein [Chloroflexota bacterium]
EQSAAPEPRPDGRDADTEVTLEMVRQRWPTVLDSIRHTSKALEAVLKDASPARVEPGDAAPVVVLSFNFPFHAAKAQDGPNLVIVQRALSRVLGVRATVRCEVEGAGTKGDRARSATGPEDPVVTKAMRIMNARVMSPEEVAELQAMQSLPVSTLETNDM